MWFTGLFAHPAFLPYPGPPTPGAALPTVRQAGAPTSIIHQETVLPACYRLMGLCQVEKNQSAH